MGDEIDCIERLASLPRSPELVIAEVVMRDVEALEAGEVAEDVLADVVDDVVRHVEPL